MSKPFESAGSALDFLVSERGADASFQRQQGEVAKAAKAVLGRKGAYILGISGHYGGQDGLLGSSNPGIRIIQGTEPVKIGDRYVALRHGHQERKPGIFLVTASEAGSGYMLKEHGALAHFSGEKALHLYGVERLEQRHVDATQFLIDTLAEELEDAVGPDIRDFSLPRVDHFSGASFRPGQVINLRELERPPFELFDY